MASVSLEPVRQSVYRIVAAATQTTDRELLRRFAEQHDEAAFEVLLRRHASATMGVCRRVLGNEADAEDACQAAFLILAHKAGSTAWQESVAGWLHRTAHQVACNARTAANRRTRREQQVRTRPAANPLEQLTAQELLSILDEELANLSERYRAPLVLCYLQGATRDEAAQQLGCPPATLKSRLERGRHRLRQAVERRGLTLPVVLAATMLSTETKCTLAAGVVRATVRAAGTVTVGQPLAGVVSIHVSQLVEGGLKSMILSKFRATLALLLFCSAFAGAALWSQGAGPNAGPGEPVAEKKALPSAPRADADKAAPVTAADPDSDGDGLPDFHEVHKYRTDPHKKDTAGKGVSDGDPQQRREFTYSVRAVIRVMPPYNLAALNDDYQDIRVRKETKQFVELEAILYPFNTNAEAIKPNRNWKKDYAGMKEYLAPGITTNWDEQMRKDLLGELAKDGIDPDKLTDKEVVEKVSSWLFKRSQYRYMFGTFFVGFPGGKPKVLPGLEKAFDREKGNPKWTVKEQFDHELFGKQMFNCKTYGTCTSTAVYQTTVLRALGIPTRMILCIPLADGSASAQVEMVDKGLTNHRVRHDACLGVVSGGSSFTSHTFCEVFVGGRWRRLNSTKLGQNILERNYLGLMVHVHTFNDLSEANLAATWGTRYASGKSDALFPHSNPYRLMEVSDHFGKYAKVPNPPADKELKRATIEKAYWPNAKDAPAEVRKMVDEMDAAVGFPSAHRFFVHCVEWFDDAGDYLQYKLFMRRADTRFILRAKGQADVPCRISMNFYTRRSKKLCELEVVIPAVDYTRMARGVAYTLHPANGRKGYEWKVRDGVKLIRE
jgi:RNA polymerase sigma factor (sigma-70 family)